MTRKTQQRHRRLRPLARMSAATIAVTGLVAAAVPASAVLTQGPVTRADGLADHVVDGNGIALVPCDVAANCGGAGLDPADATYFDATTPLFGPAGFQARYGLTGGVVPPEPLAITQGIRIDSRDPVPAGRYTVKDPWGTFTIAHTGGRLRFRPATTNRISSFLLSSTGGPAGFVGDGLTATTVTGSPTGFNRIQISGPAGGGTSQFILTGQKRGAPGAVTASPATAMTTIAAKPLNLGSVTKKRPSVGTVAMHSVGTAAAVVDASLGGANPGDFGLVNNCTSAAIASTCNIRVTYTPRPNRDASAVLVINDNNPLLAAPRRVALTGIAPDTLAPRLVSKTPAANSTGVQPGSSIKVRFNEPVRGVSRLTFTLMNNSTGNKVRAKVGQVRQSTSYLLDPARALQRGTSYTVKLNGARTGIRDLAGNPVLDMRWRFRTR